MEFIPRPEDTKRIGIKWIKWHLATNPTVLLVTVPFPMVLMYFAYRYMWHTREMNAGRYIPGVMFGSYTICRSDDYLAKTRSKRYWN